MIDGWRFHLEEAPVQVVFSSPKCFCELEVSEVRSAEDESPLQFVKQALNPFAITVAMFRVCSTSTSRPVARRAADASIVIRADQRDR